MPFINSPDCLSISFYEKAAAENNTNETQQREINFTYCSFLWDRFEKTDSWLSPIVEMIFSRLNQSARCRENNLQNRGCLNKKKKENRKKPRDDNIKVTAMWNLFSSAKHAMNEELIIRNPPLSLINLYRFPSNSARNCRRWCDQRLMALVPFLFSCG